MSPWIALRQAILPQEDASGEEGRGGGKLTRLNGPLPEFGVQILTLSQKGDRNVLRVSELRVGVQSALLSLSTANSESSESVLEVLRDLIKRGVQTPATITTDRVVGLTKDIAARGFTRADLTGQGRHILPPRRSYV